MCRCNKFMPQSKQSYTHTHLFIIYIYEAESSANETLKKNASPPKPCHKSTFVAARWRYINDVALLRTASAQQARTRSQTLGCSLVLIFVIFYIFFAVVIVIVACLPNFLWPFNAPSFCVACSEVRNRDATSQVADQSAKRPNSQPISRLTD